MSVYREVSIGTDDVVTLRTVEELLRSFDEAMGGGSNYGNWADDLYAIARRYERAGELSSLRSQILGEQVVECARLYLVPSSGDAA